MEEGRVLAAAIAEVQVEPHGVETGLKDDEMMASLRNVPLGEPDERLANTLACGRWRHVDRLPNCIERWDGRRYLRRARERWPSSPPSWHDSPADRCGAVRHGPYRRHQLREDLSSHPAVAGAAPDRAGPDHGVASAHALAAGPRDGR